MKLSETQESPKRPKNTIALSETNLFPTPKSKIFYKAKARGFFEYWIKLNRMPKVIEQTEVRVYRVWPVIDSRRKDPDRKDVSWEVIEGACPFTLDGYEYEIMSRTNYGSGDYRFDLKQIGSENTIAICYVQARDMEKFPPQLDYDTLLNTHANHDYIRMLRRQNVKLWFDAEGEGEDNMAGGNEMVTGVVGAVTEMSKQVIAANKEAMDTKLEAIQEKLEQPPAPVAPDPSNAVLAEAQKQGFQIVTTAATSAIEMMAKHAGQQYDPLQMIKAAKELMGGDGALNVLIAFAKEQAERQEKQLQSIERLFERVTHAPQQDGFDGMVGILEKANKIKEMLGVDDRPEPVPAPAAPKTDLVQSIAQNLPQISMILALGANMFHNMQAKSLGQLRDPAADLRAAQVPMPMPQPVPQSGAPAPPQGPTMLDAARKWVAEIVPAFKKHFFDAGFSGYTFAEYVRSNRTGAGDDPKGLQTYAAIKFELKRERFEALLLETEIGSMVGGIKPKFDAFMNEFFEYEEWLKQQQEAPAA